MKNIKKILALALVIVSVLAISIPALAASTNYVKTQAPGRTVNLRKTASTTAQILDTPTYGSAVYVTSAGSTWTSVTYYNPVTKVTHNGYIQTSWLVSSIPSDCYWIARYGTIDHKLTNSKKTGCAALQNDLNLYFGNNALVDDGICGNMTVAAIKKFQSENNLSTDGVAGNRTKEALYKILKNQGKI